MTQGRVSLKDQPVTEPEAKPEPTPLEKYELRVSASKQAETEAPNLMRKSSKGSKRTTRSDIIVDTITSGLRKSNKTSEKAQASQNPATIFGVQPITPIPEKPKKRNTRTRLGYILGKN